MAKQYNVNIVGNLTNDNGILSGFSVNDYATLPETLENLTINNLEIVFRFKTNSTTSNNAIFWTDKLIDDPNIPWAGLRLCNYNADNYVFDLEVTDNNAQVADIYDTTAIQANTYYYTKALYSDTDGYSLSKSEDGENYALIGTNATTDMPSNLQAIIGRAVDTDPLPLDGSIDLNESYIKVNGVIWWKGAENITKIQLRHDTAANWTSVNPILLDGEVGIETDTRKQKFGDGVTAWNSLPYDAGSTALQSITSSNVTNALGYTPYNSTNPNGYISGITSSNVTNALGYTPVNKAGDTMSGSLTTSGLLITSNAMCIIHSGITRDGSTPAEGSWKALNFVDNSSSPKRFGLIESSVLTNGSSTLGLYAYKNQSADSNNSFLIGWDGSGNKYAELNSKLLVGGILTVNGNATQQAIKNNINYSTYTTAGETYSDLQFQNYAGSKFNTIRSAITYDNTGTANGSYMIFGSNKLNSSAPDGIKIKCNSSNVISTEAPACEDNNSIVTTVSKSKAQNGYYKLGNGLIIQWGFLSQVSGGVGSILFSTAFSSSTSYSITIGLASSSANIYFSNASTTGIDYTTSGVKKDYYWVAVGY